MKDKETPRFKVNKILIGFILNDNIDNNGTNEILTLVESQSKEIERLSECLEEAVNGLEWHKSNLPNAEPFDKADYEKLDKWKQVLKQ